MKRFSILFTATTVLLSGFAAGQTSVVPMPDKIAKDTETLIDRG